MKTIIYRTKIGIPHKIRVEDDTPEEAIEKLKKKCEIYDFALQYNVEEFNSLIQAAATEQAKQDTLNVFKQYYSEEIEKGIVEIYSVGEFVLNTDPKELEIQPTTNYEIKLITDKDIREEN